jgi:hypothetical protein
VLLTRAIAVLALTGCGRFDFGAGSAAVGGPDAPASQGDTGGSCEPVGLTAGLVGWWKLDETSGDTAVDSVGGHDGLLIGGATHIPGHLGGALAFDGISGQVNIGSAVAYATHAAPFSFSVWVNLTSFMNSEPTIMEIQSDADSTSPYDVIFSDSTAWMGVSQGDGDASWISLKTLADPSTQDWHHIAVVYDGVDPLSASSFQYFVDDVAQSPVEANSYGSQVNQSRIGAAEEAANYWTGAIDDVRIYNRALSTAEISELYALTCD